jgi:hypothetical protein
MNYSTLQEAYNIDTFEKKPRPSQKSNKNNSSSNTSPANTTPMNTSPSFVETSKLALNSNKLSDYPNNYGSSCVPLQAPTYNIPISNDCKREHDEAMNVYTNANNNMNNTIHSIPTNNNNTNHNIENSLINASNSINNNNLQLPQSSSLSQTNLLPAQNMFNNLKSSDNVMPYYDEDLEQYFNINNLNDEVKYNSNSYMPNTNKQSYTNNDTSQYTNSNTVIKNGNNLLNNSSYNLTPEEKKNTEDAIAYLKSIEDKINSGNINNSSYNRTSISDPVIPPTNTGPGGFKTPDKPSDKPLDKPSDKPLDKPSDKPIEKFQDKSDNNYIYNAIFNISILLIIGIAIILLCDQIVELSIQIGMKRVVNILEPFIKANAAAAAAAQQAVQA